MNKLKERIIFLENQLENDKLRQNSINNNNSDNDNDTNTDNNNNNNNNNNEITDNNTDNNTITTSNDDTKDDEITDYHSIPFDSTSNNSSYSHYFGTSSGQVFDSELKSHLFEITQDADKLSPNSSPSTQRRHFFKDPTLEFSFSGVVMLPDKEYALSLVEKVIKFLSHEYYLYDAELFYKQIDEAYEKLRDKKPLWICYFLMTLAVGEQYLSHSPNGEIPGMGFYIAAMRLYKSSYEEPTLEFVQLLLLIAFYLQGLNSANAAFSFYGLAMRSALIQGLHRNIKYLPPIEREKRKRLWWTVFIMDNIWCSNLGHPIHVHIEDVDVDYPQENYIDLNDDFNIELMQYNVKLATILGSVMKDVYCPTKGNPSIKVKKVLDCVDRLDELRNILPTRVKNNLILSDNRSTANLYLRLNQYTIVTTRPLLLSLFKGHVQPTDPIKKVVSRCVNAAISSIDILTNLKNNDWLSAFGFWDAQFCFSALIILTICSFAGNVYTQTEAGRKINKYMKDAGNFTALDNEHKLIELDELLSKIPTYSASFRNRESEEANDTPSEYENNDNKNDHNEVIETQNKNQNQSEPNLNKDPTSTTMNPQRSSHNSHFENENRRNVDQQVNKISSPNSMALDSELQMRNSIASNGKQNIPISQLLIPSTTPDNISPQNKGQQHFFNKFSPMGNNSNYTNHPTDNSFNTFFNDINSGPIGDFTAFRNNVSPDTWNELTTNLQFWDPANS